MVNKKRIHGGLGEGLKGEKTETLASHREFDKLAV
jgi:hypothetical protein